MNKRRVILVVAAWLAAAPWARADVVIKTEGQVMGDVVEMTPAEVTVEQAGARTKVAVNEIRTIRFSDEPARLNTARMAIEGSRYEEAVTGLESINVAEVRRAEIKQDVLFYTAMAKAYVALRGSDNEAVTKAREAMFEFAKDNRSNYHYFKACELFGDLDAALGNYESARKFYDQLTQAPWADYKMRAGVALGKALLAEGKADEALKSFESVLATQAEGGSADEQRLAATLGKARCLAETGQSDEAVKLVDDVIAKTNPEDVHLNAPAYNALGIAHRKAGRIQDALLAFLHVDILYQSPKEHIEALENLIQLWEQVGQPDRAEKARETLQERYHRSPRSN